MRNLDVGDFLLCTNEEGSALCGERSMREWGRNCAGFFGRSWRLSQKASRRWMLVIIIVGLLLCWDAAFSQGCSRDGSCAGFKAVFRNGKYEQDKASFNHGQEAYVQQQTQNKALHGDESKAVESAHASVVEASVAFNDSVLLILNPPFSGLKDATQHGGHRLKCVYTRGVQTSTLSIEDAYVRCKHPRHALRKSLTGSVVTLQFGRSLLVTSAVYGKVSWKKLVYGWVSLENEGDALLFVKGLAHSKRSFLPEGLECQYGDNIRTQVTAFCQENVRCKLPPHRSQSQLVGKRVTLILKDKIFPSVVKFPSLSPTNSVPSEARNPFFLCACTLVWNGAKFLKEWVMYHSHLGVQRFFFYDNNSNDDIESVLESLQFYNVSRHPWPWLKTQEASFSHCATRASSECTWVAFIDLDEFIFPKSFLASEQKSISELPLHAMIKQYDKTDAGKLGQLKISNFNFGPSGLSMLPKSGQMVNYICRMSVPKRVKSIVRASAISPSYCSRVHYFELKAGLTSAHAVRTDVVIHHYKYQVWADFKLKFVRRAATYVTDWGQNKDLDSFDRTPGLSTEAVEPSDWAHQFCEIEDTALRDYVMNASQLHFAGNKLLWE